MTSPSRGQTRGGCACASGEPSRTPATKSHQQTIDFQKNSGLMIWSPERWFIPPWSLHFASPIATRTLTAADPRTAIRGHARQLPILHMILVRQRRPKKKKWPRGAWRNPLKRLQFFGGETLDFASPGLDIHSPASRRRRTHRRKRNSMNNNANSTFCESRSLHRKSGGFYSAAWTLTLWGSMSLGSAGATCAYRAKPNSIAAMPR